jgi:hypothetical protein
VSVEVRPASLFDIPVLKRLQTQGIPLDPQRVLTRAESPLMAVLRAPLAWQHATAYTFLARWDENSSITIGFVQAFERRAGRAEVEISYIAPALGEDGAVGHLWARLLEGACWEMAALGFQRVFASLPANSGETVPFLNAGFVIFAQEELLRCNALRVGDGTPAVTLRPQRPADAWALQRLRATTAPVGVKQAEGLLGPEAGPEDAPVWVERERKEAYVADLGDELVGHVEITRGRAGHWVHFSLHPGRPELADDLVEAGLRLCVSGGATPLYSHVRTYEGAMHPALLARGFETLGRRDLAVRQAVARIKEPVSAGVRTLEPHAGVPATPTVARARCDVKK